MVWENVIKEKGRNNFATIMVCTTMTQRSVTLCKATGSTFSQHTVSRNSRGFGRSGLLRMPKGKPKNAA
eukprot:12086646-Ditylum_brightwellii.AAC.1